MAEKNPNEVLTVDSNGDPILDGKGNKIPLELWENSPSDAMFEAVQKIPDEEIEETMKRLGIGTTRQDESTKE